MFYFKNYTAILLSPTKSDPFAASQIYSWSVTYWMLIAQRERERERVLRESFIFDSSEGGMSLGLRAGRWVQSRDPNCKPKWSEISSKYQRVLLNLRTLWNKTFHDQATSPHLFDWSDGTTGNMCCPHPGHLSLWTSAVALTAPRFQEAFRVWVHTYHSALTHS